MEYKVYLVQADNKQDKTKIHETNWFMFHKFVS